VQIRLIQFLYDTKAFGQELNCQEAGSHAGCVLCNSGKGITRKTLSKVTYPGYASQLTLNNYLRFIGVSEKPYPDNFYSATEDEILNTQILRKSVIKKEQKKITDQMKLGKKVFDNLKQPVISKILVRGEHRLKIKNLEAGKHTSFIAALVNVNEPYDWEHWNNQTTTNEIHHYKNLREEICFTHCMTEEKKRTLTNNEMFKSWGIEAERTITVCNGVKGYWPFYRLPYADIECINFDPMHCLKGIFSNYIDIFKGIIN
jgi:hypothetical protein